MRVECMARLWKQIKFSSRTNADKSKNAYY